MADEPIDPQQVNSTPNPAAMVLRDPSVMQAVASLIGGQGAPQQAAMAPPSGASAGPMAPTSPFDLRNIVSQVSGLPQFQGPTAKLEDLYKQEGDVRQQMAGMPLPKQSWLDTQGQPQKPGLGHSILRALTAIAASTGPGRAIQNAVYGPGIRSYNAQQANLVRQLDALKSQEAVPTEELRGVTGLAQAGGLSAYRGAEIGVQQQRNQIAKERSDAYAQNVANRHSDELTRLSQGWQRLSLQQQQEKAREWYQGALISVMSQRTAAGMDENSARIQAEEDMKAALSQNQWAIQHPIFNSIFGGPPLTSAPGAQTPQVMPPASQKKPTSKKGTTGRGGAGAGGGNVNWDSYPAVGGTQK